ncbi:MAG TPA: anti-sigma factor [Acidimicrobiales bacterium]|nr:anti-sigma factor [Acidimicrobiales bacterium]
MATDLTHHELEELLGAYALDAVDPDEANAVEVHLRECPRCHDEVITHREVAASLAHVGSVAPEGVWERIADSLEEVPPQLDMARVVAMTPRRPAVSPHRWAIAAASVAAAATSIIGVLGVKLVDQDRRLRTLTAAVDARSLESTAMEALVDSNARRVQLKALDDKLLGEAVMLADGTGYLLKSNLPALPADRTYQLWAVVGDARISLGVLGRRPAVTAFKAVADVRALAITDEPAGGVTSTDKPPVVLGWVPAAKPRTA